MNRNTAQLDVIEVDFFGIAGPIEKPTAYIFEAHNRGRRSWQIGFIIREVHHENDNGVDHVVEPFDTNSLCPPREPPPPTPQAPQSDHPT
ncbi:hypothetical protein JW962_04120 [Candidatus Dojkabacteria bacterium]|nr:hypothetical protein [Candidatus Dojkabacteria bacterium]